VTSPTGRRDWITAGWLVLVLMVVYNANGREIGSVDSQPTKFAARELLLRRTLKLNHVVGATPQLAERPAFAVAADGSYRSAYSPVPAIIAAAFAWPLWKTRVVDVRAMRAPNLIAVLAASLLTALAVALAFLTARRRVERRTALLMAIALGVGTGYWDTISQTLWQHETAVFGLAIAVYGFARPADRLTPRDGMLIGIGLALAAVSRPQLAPAIALLLAGTCVRGTFRAAAAALFLVAAAVFGMAVTNLSWFGNPIGGLPLLVVHQSAIHHTPTTFRVGHEGLLGLLISPSRGLLIFSPVVCVVLLAVRDASVEGWRGPLRWCAIAALTQYLFYGSYSVWWAGHTYGPRYMLDVLPVLVPLGAAASLHIPRRRLTDGVLTAALAWSILCAATGAFCYPHERWNTDPTDVDRNHARLWDWSDPQIVRCWRAGRSPQNFNLFNRYSYRVQSL
jgi:hypothetical protein